MYEFLGVILAAFIGSTLTYFLTKWGSAKRFLYEQKIKAYMELADSLIQFEKICIKSNPPSVIMYYFANVISRINRAYLFMPKAFVIFIQKAIGDPFETFKNQNTIDNDNANLIFSYYTNANPNEGKPDPKLTNALLKVFNPFLTKIPEIGDKLKQDIGTYKFKIHFYR